MLVLKQRKRLLNSFAGNPEPSRICADSCKYAKLRRVCEHCASGAAYPLRMNKETESVKKGIHPEYVLSKVSCACGNKFETRSTRPAINVEICSSCHPFFTGKQKFIDSEGRVDRFNRKYGKK